MPEYAVQLQEIVKALNRPTTSPWIISGSAATLAVIGAIIGQCILMWLTDSYRRLKLRRLLYKELGAMFLIVDGVMRNEQIEDDLVSRTQWQIKQIREHLNFRSEKYMTDNQELYVHLDEHWAADMLYGRFHKIVDDPDSFHVNTNVTLRIFANTVYEGRLKRRWFKRSLPQRTAKGLLERVDHHQQVDEELRQRIILRRSTSNSEDSALSAQDPAGHLNDSLPSAYSARTFLLIPPGPPFH